MRNVTSTTGALITALLLSFASTARAQAIDEASRTAARALGNSGVEAYQAGSFPEASEKLEKSYAIARVPSLGLWSARALVKLGKLVEAANRYLETVSLQVPEGDFEIQKQAQTDAQKELDELKPKIPALTIALEGARPEEVSVTVDGVPLASSLLAEPRLVNPGEHRVEGTRGSSQAVATVTLTEGQRAPALLRFAPEVPAAAPAAAAAADKGGGSSNTLAVVALSVGGVGIVVGSIAGVMAIGKKGEIDDSPSCDGNRCSDHQLVNRYNTLRTVSSVGFIAGGALAALGVTLLLTSGSSNEPSATAFVGPSLAGVRGKF